MEGKAYSIIIIQQHTDNILHYITILHEKITDKTVHISKYKFHVSPRKFYPFISVHKIQVNLKNKDITFYNNSRYICQI